MGQFLFGDTGHPLEVIVAGIAEVCGAKAEENSHRAAVPAFILQEVCAMLGAHLARGVEYYFCYDKKKRIKIFLRNNQHTL